jgi:hypothetical protein
VRRARSTSKAPPAAVIKIRTIALDAVLRAAASLKGWEMKSGGELLAEASLVETWIRTGRLPAEEKGKT